MPRAPRSLAALAPGLLASPALAQESAGSGLWGLFVQSFDIFSIALLAGSLTAGMVIYQSVVEVRERRILRPASLETIRHMLYAGRWSDLEEFVGHDASFFSQVLRGTLGARRRGRRAMHDAAELAASEACARLFRRIEPLNVIGNLGPLVGLAGTVWGMILAFTSLGEAGGQATPADLSLGISKALFHTLLGLCLAIPCLVVFGLYRSVVDRICNRGMTISADLVEQIPDEGGAGR
jgi:biopolymer transport protein ExbB